VGLWVLFSVSTLYYSKPLTETFYFVITCIKITKREKFYKFQCLSRLGKTLVRGIRKFASCLNREWSPYRQLAVLLLIKTSFGNSITFQERSIRKCREVSASCRFRETQCLNFSVRVHLVWGPSNTGRNTIYSRASGLWMSEILDAKEKRSQVV